LVIFIKYFRLNKTNKKIANRKANRVLLKIRYWLIWKENNKKYRRFTLISIIKRRFIIYRIRKEKKTSKIIKRFTLESLIIKWRIT